MIRATVKQFPMLVFFLFVILCVTLDEYRMLLFLTCTASIFWLAYAHHHNRFSYKSLFKQKKQKSA